MIAATQRSPTAFLQDLLAPRIESFNPSAIDVLLFQTVRPLCNILFPVKEVSWISRNEISLSNDKIDVHLQDSCELDMRENEVLFFLLIVVMMRSRKTGSTGTAVSIDPERIDILRATSTSNSRLLTYHLGSCMPRWPTSSSFSGLIRVTDSSTSSYSPCRPSYCQSQPTKDPKKSFTSGLSKSFISPTKFAMNQGVFIMISE